MRAWRGRARTSRVATTAMHSCVSSRSTRSSTATTRTTRRSRSACWTTTSVIPRATARRSCWRARITPPVTRSTATRWSRTAVCASRSESAAGKHRMIGESHARIGGERFVAGRARFVDDVHVPGMLHAAVLRSSHAHARLVSIDTKRARDFPGVRAVLTAADVSPTAIIPNRVPAPAGTERYLQPVIARDVVRYVGEPVALIVADDPYVARDALERVDVVYEPLPACASTTAALAAGAPRLHPGTDSNNVATITRSEEHT